MQKIKRLIAAATITLGALFALSVLLSIWRIWPEEILYGENTIIRLTSTLGVLSAAFLALLAVVKMAESKSNGNK